MGPTARESDMESIRLLGGAFADSLRLAASVSARSICFPALSCGVRRCSHEVCARTALTSIYSCDSVHEIQHVEFMLGSKSGLERWVTAVTALLGPGIDT